MTMPSFSEYMKNKSSFVTVAVFFDEDEAFDKSAKKAIDKYLSSSVGKFKTLSYEFERYGSYKNKLGKTDSYNNVFFVTGQEVELKKVFPADEDFIVGKYSSGGEIKMPWNVFKGGKLNPERVVVEKA